MTSGLPPITRPIKPSVVREGRPFTHTFKELWVIKQFQYVQTMLEAIRGIHKIPASRLPASLVPGRPGMSVVHCSLSRRRLTYSMQDRCSIGFTWGMERKSGEVVYGTKETRLLVSKRAVCCCPPHACLEKDIPPLLLIPSMLTCFCVNKWRLLNRTERILTQHAQPPFAALRRRISEGR